MYPAMHVQWAAIISPDGSMTTHGIKQPSESLCEWLTYKMCYIDMSILQKKTCLSLNYEPPSTFHCKLVKMQFMDPASSQKISPIQHSFPCL